MADSTSAPPPVEIPPMFLARQRFDRPRVDDPAAAVAEQLERLLPPSSLRPGAPIGVTVGSRGIANIAEIARAAVDFLRARGAAPFIIPAMGSHGGARAEGQAQLIAHLGVTEASMGCPIRSSMETRSLGTTPEGIDVRIAEAAWEADGILVMNRIKPHTDYKGEIESGLAKMCAIGLGKYDGAREIHGRLFDLGLGVAIRRVAEAVLSTGRIIGGLAILENAYHETARIAAVPAGELLDREAELLVEARRLMGRLPLGEIDVLVCDLLGKNISGTGLDTNVIGRGIHGYVEGVPWCEGMPSVMRIVVRDLSAESDGNAVGMGLADFVTERFLSKVDQRVTALNSMTGCAPAGARTPIVLADDREAITAAIRSSRRRPAGPLIVHVRDTLALVDGMLSEACRPLVEGRSDIEILSEPAPLEFDAGGYLKSPFAP
ncbi:MAG: DUF2088 domain-containing protein [Planctomycetes bacterium]|nr:DUF2088 domain-containing protein [Planctomycetota bacterium]